MTCATHSYFEYGYRRWPQIEVWACQRCGQFVTVVRLRLV